MVIGIILGVHGTGVIEDKDDNGLEYKTCSFTFDSINMSSGLTVVLKGENSLILKTRNHGNISVGTTYLPMVEIPTPLIHRTLEK